MSTSTVISLFFFFNDTATTEIYTLSLHDALPISPATGPGFRMILCGSIGLHHVLGELRSEEHTSELQSHLNLVCRLLLEKKKNFLDIFTFTFTFPMLDSLLIL